MIRDVVWCARLPWDRTRPHGTTTRELTEKRGDTTYFFPSFFLRQGLKKDPIDTREQVDSARGVVSGSSRAKGTVRETRGHYHNRQHVPL